MDIETIRKDFPLLQNPDTGIYFDNACQSLRPGRVIDAVSEYYKSYSACAGRSNHHLASLVTQKCEDARSSVARFLNAKRKEEIVFTRNTTEGINLVAHSIGLKAGDSVIISDKEHNSNLIPWQVLKEKSGIRLKILRSKDDNTFDIEAYKKELGDDDVRLVSLGFTSNLDGVTIPAKEIIELTHKRNISVLLDGAQAAAHFKLNVTELDVDYLAFSGHKMLGPSGTGVLYAKYALLEKLDPFMVGGDTVRISTYDTHEFLPPPEKFEAGLQDYAGIIGLGEAVNYLMNIGMDNIHDQESILNEYISGELVNIQGLKIVGPGDPNKRGGVISFYIPGKDHHQIALMLDASSKIMVRSGQHCVHSWFADRKVPGTVRASVYFYNTLSEAEIFVKELRKIIDIL